MGIFNLFKKKTEDRGKRISQKMNLRQYDSAKFDNLFAGWTGTSQSPDEELRSALPTIRARTRGLCQNSEYARKFLALCKSNVIGSHGIRFQAKTRQENGVLDGIDNNYLEGEFFEWGMNKDYCSINGRLDWFSVQQQAMETLARDGEVFIRLMKGTEGNPYGLSLWVLEGDAIPINHNLSQSNENYIVMGIEQDQFGKPLAYYQAIKTPVEQVNYQFSNETERVPADEMIHLYIAERPGQSRGVPWLQSAIRPLQMLHKYQESELVSSRVGSSAQGFFLSPDSTGYVGTGEDATGDLVTEFSPGQFHQLPAGVQFQAFEPNHPTTAYSDFVKSVLRAASSGCLVSYNSLANDLESVNYSSIRAGQKEEQDHWKGLQNMMIQGLCYPVYKAWLKMAITTGQLNLPMSKLRKFHQVKWHPRGWSYVDPLKELQAKELALKIGVTSLSEIAGEQGKEYTDILAQLAAEKDLADGLGLILTPPISEEVFVQKVVEDKTIEEETTEETP